LAQQDAPETSDQNRSAVLKDIGETVMVILGFAWMALLVIEFTSGLAPALSVAFNIIWVVFILDFTVRLGLATDRIEYLRANWLTGISLLIPAFRVLRVVRVVRLFRMASVMRGLRLVRLLTSFNRSARALGATMRRRGFGYVIALTLIVVLAGAAGMYTFERDAPGQGGFRTYGDALWWTAMIITTLGSQHWPASAEGRILCLILSIYAFTVFGYITAVLASHFIGREVSPKSEPVSPQDVRRLQDQIVALHADLRRWQPPAARQEKGSDPS